MPIIYRYQKNAPLTSDEIDGNFAKEAAQSAAPRSDVQVKCSACAVHIFVVHKIISSAVGLLWLKKVASCSPLDLQLTIGTGQLTPVHTASCIRSINR